MAQTPKTQNPAPSVDLAERVVGWYQQQLAQAQEQIANLWAVNQLLGEQLQAERYKNDPNRNDTFGSDI